MKKQISADDKETIQRALGILEGIGHVVEQNIAEGIFDAIEMIEAALKEK